VIQSPAVTTMSYADGWRPVGVISHGSGGYPGDSIPYRDQYSLLSQLDAALPRVGRIDLACEGGMSDSHKQPEHLHRTADRPRPYCERPAGWDSRFERPRQVVV